MGKFYNYISQLIGQLCKVIQNAIQLKARVYRVFKNGQLPLSNNLVE